VGNTTEVVREDLISGYGRINDSYVLIREAPRLESESYSERLMENQLVEILDRTSTDTAMT
jgi:hypothetical protein